MKKTIILILFLTSCSSQIEENLRKKKFDFSNINFEEFKLKLIEYSKKSSYPNIDN